MTPNAGEFYGMDTSGKIEPTISNGDWGWLCSGYAPVLDADGNVVCHVGCDVSMDDVMKERQQFLWSIVIGALVFTALVLAVAVLLVNRVVVKPLHLLTSEMKKFHPADNASYETAGIIQLDIRSNDEIQDIYQEIHTMEANIIDYLNSLSVLQKDKEQAELDIRERDVQFGKISQEAYRDTLTGVGSKTAYVRKLEELNAAITAGTAKFAIVMVDMNNLKKINDEHGHKNGDLYIKGCCHLICETFKHSPVFRIGGDEFAVILQGSDYAHRQDYAEALRAAYTEAFENTEQEPWQRYSASVGTAVYESDDSTVELVFKRADRAMYEDKEAFRKKYGSYR